MKNNLITTEKERMLHADRYPEVVRRYTEIQEPTPKIVRESWRKSWCMNEARREKEELHPAA